MQRRRRMPKWRTWWIKKGEWPLQLLHSLDGNGLLSLLTAAVGRAMPILPFLVLKPVAMVIEDPLLCPALLWFESYNV